MSMRSRDRHRHPFKIILTLTSKPWKLIQTSMEKQHVVSTGLMMSDKDSFNFRINLFKPLGFDKPLIYIILGVAVCLYIYLFYLYNGDVHNNIIEEAKERKIFSMAFFYLFFFSALFVWPSFAQRIESRWLRSILVFTTTVVIMICAAFLAWNFSKFDHEKLDSYTRLLPIRNSPRFRNRETLFYRDIKTVYRSENGNLNFILENGRKRSLSIENPRVLNVFLLTLYKECMWLREYIENEFGSIEQNVPVHNRVRFTHFNFTRFLLMAPLIWAILLAFTTSILYILKLKSKTTHCLK